MIFLLVSFQSYVRRGRRLFRQLIRQPRVLEIAQGMAYTLAGFFLSAASLGNSPQTFCLGLLCAAPAGWPLLLLAAGSAGGYILFWGSAGLQGLAWVCGGLLTVGLLGGRKINWRVPLLLPSLATLIAAAAGLAFQVLLEDTTPILIYLLRVVIAGVSARLFTLAFERREPFVDWAVEGIAVLALGQVTVMPWLGLGYVAAAALATGGAFPAVALAGLALDLSQLTKIPMTAVLSAVYLLRLLPGMPKVARCTLPAGVYLLVMYLSGSWDLYPLPGLILGGVGGLLLPQRPGVAHRRGEVGIAQVRLEVAAGVLRQTEQILLETRELPVDEQSIMIRAVDRACSGCPCRKTCTDRARMAKLSPELLHKPGLQTADLGVSCKKTARMVTELQRSQAQLRAVIADREQQREYREAVGQQYQFVAAFLRQLSDGLGKTVEQGSLRFQPEVAVCSVGKETANGDRCVYFAGTAGRYYVVLCDGMGTGLGAAQEARTASEMLRKQLSAGFPAEYALRSLNSLCALSRRAGAVTVDLAEIRLDTGAVALYKWGAMPSYVVSRLGAEKIGTTDAPPGLSVTEGRETVDRLSLRRGETLVMLSDGVGGEVTLGRAADWWREPAGEVAAAVLETVEGDSSDDATVAVVRLRPLSSATQ